MPRPGHKNKKKPKNRTFPPGPSSSRTTAREDSRAPPDSADDPRPSASPSASTTPPAAAEDAPSRDDDDDDDDDRRRPGSSHPPCIENKWNGARVLDVAAFVASRHAAAPCMDDPACVAYATPAFREMALRVLPEDTALILWYNKSRKSARICPACRRFYIVGDVLLPHLLDDQSGSRAEYVDPRNLREKRISGICSLMCFAIASYNWPGVIGAWGKRASDIDADTQAILQGPGANVTDDGMGIFMKLTRMDNIVDVISQTYHAGSVLY